MKSFSKLFLVAMAMLVFTGMTTAAQTPSANAQASLQLTIPESVSVSLGGAGYSAGVIALTPGGGNYTSQQFTVTASWSLNSSRSAVEVCQGISVGSFGTAPINATQTNFFSSINGGTATNFNNQGSSNCVTAIGAGSFGWAGSDVFDAGSLTGAGLNQTMSRNVVITTQGLPTTGLPAGTYTATYTALLIVQ